MTNSGDAAEQVVRLSLEGFEVAARLTGSAAKNIAILLASVLKQEATQANKTRGKARLTNMIKSGKELKVFSIPNKDLKKFTEQAKRYGVLYCVLRDKNTRGDNVPIDIIARAEDASKIQRIVSVMRSRGVSVSIILQNLAQLKALFEKQWESIVGNCDEFLYLGGNEQSTHKYVSELLGKETIDTNTYGKSSGRSGNYSTNYQISGRELLTPDEVRMLDNQYAILFIRGERPIMDFKYDILKHPNVALTTDGKEKPYKHGEVTIPHSSISVLAIDPDEVEESNYGETTYELLSDEDFEVDNNF